MPVQIVNENGNTSIEDGTIKKNDLSFMENEYRQKVALTPIPPRNVVAKRYSFYFSKAQVLALLSHYSSNTNANAIEISLGIHVPGSLVSCGAGSTATNTDNSNCLGAIISMANIENLTPFNAENDFVLINGYHPAVGFGKLDECCPGSHPPPDNFNVA